MTDHERNEILGYIASEFISPMCDDKRIDNSVWREMTGEKFNKLAAFVNKFVKEEPTTFKVRRASSNPIETVVKEVKLTSMNDLIEFAKAEGEPIIVDDYFSLLSNDDEEEYSLLIYDDYLE